MEQPKLKVQSANVDDLIPYANNAKIHTAEQIDQICASILQFGFNDPVAIWLNAEGEPEIVEGHGRVMAAKKLGISKVPVITLDHLDDEARRAYTHVHNKLTMNTGFDWATLDEELANLNFDFSEFGFDVPGTFELDRGERDLPDAVTVKLTFTPSSTWENNESKFVELVNALDGVDMTVQLNNGY